MKTRLPLIADVQTGVPPEGPKLPKTPARFHGSGTLTDPQERVYSYLRLSVTDRCDLGCVYCMPPGGELDHAPRPELLTFEESARIASVFASAGVSRIRFTGGEPLVRKDVVRLVELVNRRVPTVELAMTTNATRMGELARPLFSAGLRSINVSLDTLEADKFKRITRGGDLRRVIAGIHAALSAGMNVKLNTVPLRNENEDEFAKIVEWAWSLGITPRFIELMPLGEGATISEDRYVSADSVRQSLFDLIEPEAPADDFSRVSGPARYVKSRRTDHRVGFITAVSSHFCDTCNRVRVSSTGDIRACLASRRAVSLRDLIRAGKSDRDLRWALDWSLTGKEPGHSFLSQEVEEHKNVGMSLIGG